MAVKRFITDKFARWQTRRLQNKVDRQVTAEQGRRDQHERDLEKLVYRVYARYSHVFEKYVFEDSTEIEDVPIGLRSFINPHTGEREAEIILTDYMTRRILTVIFSRRAVPPLKEEWRSYISPATSHSQPRDATQGWGRLNIATYTTTISVVVFSFKEHNHQAATLVVKAT